MATQYGFNFTSIREALTKEISKLPKQMAIEVKDESVKNIDNESFYGVQWPSAKTPSDHKLLDKTGKLKQAVKNSVNSGDKGNNYYNLTVINDYGLWHNEGTKTLPKRQFLGESSIQNKKITELILKALENKWI